MLENAKQTLQKFDCVLFVDQFTQDVIDLFRRLGIALEEQDIPKMNVTEPEPISEQLLEEVRQANDLDIRLYAYAKEHLQKKDTEYRLRSRSFEKISLTTHSIDYSFDLPLNGRGWSYRESLEGERSKYSIYRYVMDEPAYIYFSLEEGSIYDLYFTARSLTNETVPKVRVNDKELPLCKLNSHSFSLYHGKIPKNWIANGPTEIVFYSSALLQYKDPLFPAHTHHFLPLSFAINRIRICRSLEADF